MNNTMKKRLLLPLLSILVLFTACSSDDDNTPTAPPDPVLTVTEVDYTGKITMGETAINTRCTVVYDNTSKLCILKFKGLKFADAMPTIDLNIGQIPCNENGGRIEFHTADPIIPTVTMTETGLSYPAQEYSMTDIEGVIGATTLTISASMQGGSFTFEGTLVPVYMGSMNVLATGADKVFICKDVKCEAEINEQNNIFDLYIYGAKFAETMPVTIDIKLEGLPLSSIQEGYKFDVKRDIVPLVRVGQTYAPMEAFTFSSIRGIIHSSNTLSFDAVMTRGQFSYSGSRIQ